MTLAEGARLVGARGRLMQALPGGGAMVSIEAPESEVMEALAAAVTAEVSLAAVNGPRSVVISGSEAAVLQVAESFAGQGVRTKRLAVSHAFHSALMDPMLQEFARVAETIAYREPTVAMVSNVSGELAGAEVATAGYWVRHVRQSVRFAQGVKALLEAGGSRFVEIGPKPTLLGLVSESAAQGEVMLCPSLRGRGSEAQEVLEALGSWVAQGGSVDWKGVFPEGGRRVELPTYAWQRQGYWVESTSLQRSGGGSTGHALLGVRVPAAGADALYESVLSATEPSWLGDHRVGGQVVVPGAAGAEPVRGAAENRRPQVVAEIT